MIAAHLRALGYRRKRVKVKGVSSFVWTNEPDTRLNDLKKKLDALTK